MSSESNYVFNITSKPEMKIEKEPFHSIVPTFDVHTSQVLLNKNLYLALKEPLVFVADYLEVDPEQLSKAIAICKTNGGGWIATVSDILMNGLQLQVLPYVGITEMKTTEQRPMLGIKSQTRTCWSYQTKGYAGNALLLHLVFNTKLEFKQHWAKPLLQNTEEIALLLPCSLAWEMSILVCFIYQHDGYVWVKQFQELDCMVGLPFKIGNYYTKAQQVHSPYCRRDTDD
jgi:hypothetical protein